ncbi:hypothetical protein CVT26_005853 [Gymnopilus dilepis]|uniref:Cytochrome P450 n=1 Tax=Gymnopilus dilepis TaxID=231916 RepID=A0A409WBW0_9AGAR|nr:hypothetical protein CVT26_005853 [Gymnopilus dilepis]
MSVLSRALEIITAHPLHALATAILVGIFLIVRKSAGRFRNGLPLPPGPEGWPVIGNLFDMPREKPWDVYHEWSKIYGDIMYFEVLGQPFLVLDSVKRTNEIFDKRSSNYSDRMQTPQAMVIELMKWGYNLAFQPYGNWWRRHRKSFNNHFRPDVLPKYRPIQLREVRALLNRRLTSPEKFMHHIRHTFAATIMGVSYGISVKGSDDPYISRAEEALGGLAAAGIPGSFLVDMIPLLKYVPAWLPGASFRKKAAYWKKVNEDVVNLPYEYVEDQVAKGTAVPCVATALMERLPDKSSPSYAEEMKIAQDVVAVSYIDRLLCAILLYGNGTLSGSPATSSRRAGRCRRSWPSAGLHRSRRATLYQRTVIKETMRWHQVTPLAVAHMCTADDEYDGYFIPKGTLVIGNAWSILHDPSAFSQPMEFRPEHYLKDGKLDPNARDPDCAAFGFGRRICPGRHMSSDSLYAIISCVLAVFDIKPPKDEHGNNVQLKPDFTTGMLSLGPVQISSSIQMHHNTKKCFSGVELIAAHPLHALAITLVLGVLLKGSARHGKGLPLPPGPKGWPIIGNYFDIPHEKPWIAYHEWTKIYGDLIYFEVLGRPFLILGSVKRTSEIFDKRSSNYSDRMRMDWDYDLAFLPYGPWWRRHRKAFNEHFRPDVLRKYRPIHSREVRALLQRLLTSPEDFMHHIRHTFAAVIMRISYGIAVEDSSDPYISRAEEALKGLAVAGIPGSFLVDMIPLLKYVPAWIPGASFKKKAAYWKKINDDVVNLPFEYVEDQVAKGLAVPSVATALIDRLPDKNSAAYIEERKIAQNTAGVAYGELTRYLIRKFNYCGSDGFMTQTLSSVQAFFLAMAIYPDVQRRAQEELDAVVGQARLPDFRDRDALPYINAIVKESVRWHQVAPMAIPHMCTSDDEYDGYFIPKGTLVIGNAWSILHDPSAFSHPMDFRPEHYLKDGKVDPNARDPECAAFGFGRRLAPFFSTSDPDLDILVKPRICPGRHMSSDSLYTIISCVLAVYDIKPPKDEHGNNIRLRAEFTSGLASPSPTRYPVPFKCTITPRSALAESVIRECLEVDD